MLKLYNSLTLEQALEWLTPEFKNYELLHALDWQAFFHLKKWQYATDAEIIPQDPEAQLFQILFVLEAEAS